jgi:hypothetical protein
MSSKLSEGIQRKVSEFLDQTVLRLKASLQGSSSSGKLASSIETIITEDGGKILIAFYAYFLIYGRRPGKMPPVSAIKDWLRDRGIDEKAAWPIARTIAREGSKLWQKYRGGNSGIFAEALNEQIIRDFQEDLGKYVQIEIASSLLNFD